MLLVSEDDHNHWNKSTTTAR